MKNKALAFRIILMGSSLAFCVVFAACIVGFSGLGAGFSLSAAAAELPIFGGAALLFCGITLVVVGRLAHCYHADFPSLQPVVGEAGRASPEYRSALAELGAAPLKALISYLLIAGAFVLGIFLIPGAPGAAVQSRGATLSFVMSIAMLSAAFLYVLTDKLALTTLLSCDLQTYPEDLREYRQRRKNLIIPMFTTLMTLVFAYSCTFLFGRQVEGAKGAVFSRFFATVLPMSAIYVAVVLALMFTWGANTALLYRSVTKELEQLSSTDRDLTGRISICSVDEIATISGMVNVFCAGLAKSLREIRSTFGQLSRLQERLFAGIRSSSGASADIAGGIDELMGAIEREDAAVRRSLESAKALVEHGAAVAASSKEQSVSLTSSVERVQAALLEVGRLSRESETARTRTAALVEVFGTGETNIRTAVESVKAVASRSSDLVEINKLISAVASRTNLLAMNASIEAAHAGEAGRGFSVVADEIRKLAESTAEHTRRSKESLTEIVGLITRALEASESTGSSFGMIRSSVEELDRTVRATAASMGDQEFRNKEVLGLLGETEALAQGLAQTAQALDAIAREMNLRLGEAADESSRSSGVSRSMSERNAELRRAVAQVDELARESAELNGKIDTFLGSFKA
ncbi:MAG TPA: methyl-accepting chemotaxis protein [Rectinemataceae bacterium]|nr:methyl-accepting chemotaxis protein [Rectinemataceae bacterium]